MPKPNEEQQTQGEESVETPATEDEKTVAELLAEGEEEEAPVEDPPTEPAGDEGEGSEEGGEEAAGEEAGSDESGEDEGGEDDPEGGQQQVPVSALQRERKRRQEEAARAAQLQDELERLRQSSQQQHAADPTRPKPEDFDTSEAYEDAVYDWRRRKDLASEQQSVLAERENEIKAKFNRSLEDAKKKFKDFDDSLDLVFSFADRRPAYARALVVSKNPGAVINFLAKNPEEGERIRNLSPEDQMKAIGVIEHKLSAAPKPNKVTKAPKPINAEGGGASTSVPQWKENMTPAERAAFDKYAKESGKSVAELYGIEV